MLSVVALSVELVTKKKKFINIDNWHFRMLLSKVILLDLNFIKDSFPW